MSARKSVIAVAFMSLAASAHAGYTSVISEPATVMLIFVALATIGLVAGRKTSAPIED